MADHKTALEFTDVVKRFGRRVALDGLNMRIPSGITCGLVGSNGAGKTTSIAVAAGLLNLNRGAVSILNEGPFDPARHSGRVSMMPQDSDIPLYARVRDILAFYARLQAVPARTITQEVERVIDWVHLSDRADAPVRTLSHGMRRRIVVAQAFLGNPELVLLDEPMSGLDPREVINIRQLLNRRADGQTVVISSHNLHELELVCDHVAFIEKGRLVRQDSMRAITGRTQTIHFQLSSCSDQSLQRLRQALPDTVLERQEEETKLSCEYSGSAHSAAHINRIILMVLLEEGVEILEVRRGKTLESAYISHSSG
jgi:ABC-2 type transport system ATP-binding protein